MNIVLPGILEGINLLKDKSCKLTFITQELTPKEFGDLSNFHGTYSKILVSDGNITEEKKQAVEDFKTEFQKPEKYNSKWLRSVLYRVWEQNPSGEFNDFYESQIEIIGRHYIDKYLE